MMNDTGTFFLAALLSVLVAFERSGEFFGNFTEGYRPKIKPAKASVDSRSAAQPVVSVGPLFLVPLLALLVKGGLAAKTAALAKGAAAAKSAILAKGAAAAAKAAAAGLAA